MRRPCVITYPVMVNDAKPFEALQMDLSFHINDLDIYISDYDDAKNRFNFHQSFRFNTLKELEAVKYLLQWQLAKALNPPIKVTQAVLKALPEGSDFLAHKVGYNPIWQSAFYCSESKKWWSQDEPLDESYIIKSDGCSETLARLLQFTLDGVCIKEKETSND